jgi:hypothetical protein
MRSSGVERRSVAPDEHLALGVFPKGVFDPDQGLARMER